MNKKLIISLVILTIVTAIAGYFLYQWYIKNNPPSKFGQMGGNLENTLQRGLNKIYGCKDGEKYDLKQKRCIVNF